jgi:hypothetical protein
LTVFAGVIYSYVWAFWFQHEDMGSFTEIKNGTTSVASATSPRAVMMSLVGLAVYCVLLNTRVKEQQFRIAPMWRRAAAFAIDFWFSIFTLCALFGFLDVLLEATRTGKFQWQYHRDYLVLTDWINFILVFASLAAIVAYFLLPLMRKGQTVGCWIFRLATVNLDGYVIYIPFSTGMRRLLAEFRGVCSPLRTFRKRDEQGRTFYDIDSGFTVVRY